MALTGKKYDKFYKETGSGDDKITASNKEYIKTAFEFGATHGFHDIMDDPKIGPLVYMIQQMQDELDYLRTEISANKDKTGISSSQTSAITANTAKTGITTQQATDITDNKNEAKRLDGLITTNTTNITANARSIGVNNLAAINVGAYPPLGLLAPAGTTQSHSSEIVYDTLQKKYFLNIYYIEDTPAKGGRKGQRVIRTGQIELK